jgi:hypothetical protein
MTAADYLTRLLRRFGSSVRTRRHGFCGQSKTYDLRAEEAVLKGPADPRETAAANSAECFLMHMSGELLSLHVSNDGKSRTEIASTSAQLLSNV